MEFINTCGCKVIWTEYGIVDLVYCPKHSACEDMVEALEITENDGTVMKTTRIAVAKALSKARGEPVLCPHCGAHLLNWMEMFREVHNCQVNKKENE